jgi:asparagine synthase (glutamine-hydrolysing)
MCGFAGFLDASAPIAERELRARAAAMAGRLLHRGPDAAGEWVDPAAGIALGHRRLAILDLSPNGHQPMQSHCGRYVIAFNGEIYNHRDLRASLEVAPWSRRWRGHSDTEVLLEAIACWGLKAALQCAVGMFALALWDRDDKALHLARDRIGEKPLYYGWMRGTLLFGSELKALQAHPAWRGEIDRDALALYLRYSYIPAPHSIYRGVRKLAPGTVASLPLARARHQPGATLDHQTYWSLGDVAQRGLREPFRGTPETAGSQLERLLREAIREQMLADVPVGAFLSGGIDSSTVVALMQQESGQRVRTFTIGFHERGYDEATHARNVARHLGTDHTELYITPREALAVVPRLPQIYDEPFADSSQIPMVLVAGLARERVTVCLSGDGGDELFGGYPRYRQGLRLWPWLRGLPSPLRHGLSSLLATAVAPTVAATQQAIQLASMGAARLRAGDKVARLAEMLALEQPVTFYRNLVSHWRTPEQVVLGGVEAPHLLSSAQRWPELGDFGQRMMYLDAMTYLPDDILVKVDRAAMASSLESRMPLLDHRVVEFVWSLPSHLRISDGESKQLLRQILYRYVPRALVDRPKMGFGIPVDLWLRGPLRDWAEALLTQRRLHEEGLLSPGAVRQKWLEHLSGKRDWRYLLWNVLAFQAWLEHERGASQAPVAQARCA